MTLHELVGILRRYGTANVEATLIVYLKKDGVELHFTQGSREDVAEAVQELVRLRGEENGKS